MAALQTKGKAVSSTVVSIQDFEFDDGFLAEARSALVSSDANISLRFDGGDPTATLGHFLKANEMFMCPMTAVPQLKMIRQTSDANVTITIMR